MQRLRLTEDFAIEFGNTVAHPFSTKFLNTGEAAPVGNSPLHIVKFPKYDNTVLLLNSDESVTNNVREISCIDKNATYKAFLSLNTAMNGYEIEPDTFIDGSYINCLYEYPAFKSLQLAYDGDDMLNYIQCKLYAISGFTWPKDVAGVYIKIYQTINDVEYQLCNKVVLRTTENRYNFQPIKSNTVVLDNEQFTTATSFEILDLQYIANIDSDTINTHVRPAIFGQNEPFVFKANIDVAIGFIYTDDIRVFNATPFNYSTIFSFNEFSLREIKKAPLLIDADTDLYASCKYIASSVNGNSYIEMSMNHREMSLDSFVASMHPIDGADGVHIEYDVIVSPFNVDGNLIDSQSTHMSLCNVSSTLSDLRYIPTLLYSPNTKLRPFMCMIYVTATMTLQNDLGDLRFSRSAQVLLNEQQIIEMCWQQQPQVKFVATDVVYKKHISKTVINKTDNLTSAIKDRVIQISKPEYIHIRTIVLNDKEVAESNTVVYTCPKNATYNVALQIIDSNNDAVNFNDNVKFIAKSGKGFVKDSLTRNSNMIEFALSNTEGKVTTWDIMTLDGKFIQRIQLQS